jgi:hypothetical protein
MKKQNTIAKKLTGYSMAGCSLATGLFTAAFSADGQVVYTDIEPEGPTFWYDYGIDLNNDGITDITISTGGTDSAYFESNYIDGEVAPGNAMAVESTIFPLACDSGVNIGNNLSWRGEFPLYMALLRHNHSYGTWTTFSWGNWNQQTEKFLGIRFTINNEQHYGWVRLTTDTHSPYIIIHDYAYESAPDVPIIAGDIGCTPQTVYADVDGDGFGDVSNSQVITGCLIPTGFVPDSTDCDDTNNTINPAAIPTKTFDYRYGGSDQDQLTTIIKTSDGGYLLGGKSKSPVSFEKSEANRDATGATYDYWLVKIDANGVKQWDKTYGGIGDEGNVKLLQLSDGNYLVGGYSYSGIGGDKTQAAKGSSDFWILKISSSGTIIWQKDFGGSGEDIFQAMQPTPDGGFVLAGSSSSPISGDKTQDTQGLNDYWILKISASGIKQWDKRFGGSKDDLLAEIKNSSGGGYLLGGRSFSPADGNKTQGNYDASLVTSDYWVVKLNANGNYSWDKRFGGTNDDLLFSIQQDNTGNYLLGGYSKSLISGDKTMNLVGGKDYWVVNTDASGNKEWDAQYGGSADDESYMLELMPDGGFVIAGSSASGIGGDKSQGSQGLRDYWMVETSSGGAKLWDRRYGGSNVDIPTAMQITNDGGFILGGYSQSPISGDKTQNNHDGSLTTKDYWIVKLDGHAGYQFFWVDTDHDGYGDINKSTLACTAPVGYVSNNTDCNDANSAIHPNAADLCNSIDDNCNGVIDENSIIATVTPTGSVTSCSGALITLAANTGTGILYQWKNGSSNIQGAINSTYTTNVAGSYKVKENNGFNCSSTSAVTTITAAINPAAMITPLGNLDICTTGSVDLRANNGSGYTYQWKKGNNSITGATSKIYSATTVGTYKVTVTNTSGCSKMSAGTQVVKSCKEDLTASALPSVNLLVYPNPAEELTTIQFSLPQSSHVRVNVYDMSGKEISVLVNNDLPAGDHSLILNTGNLAKGVYIVRMISDFGIENQKLVVE